MDFDLSRMFKNTPDALKTLDMGYDIARGLNGDGAFGLMLGTLGGELLNNYLDRNDQKRMDALNYRRQQWLGNVPQNQIAQMATNPNLGGQMLNAATGMNGGAPNITLPNAMTNPNLLSQNFAQKVSQNVGYKPPQTQVNPYSFNQQSVFQPMGTR